MKPEDFYKEEFAKDYELVKDLKEQPFFNFRSMMEFAEMYHAKQCAITDVVFNEEDLCDDSCKYYCTKGFTQERECLTGQSEVEFCNCPYCDKQLNKNAIACDDCNKPIW